MWRIFIEEFFLFILPFGVFAGWLVARRKNPLDVEHWDGHKFWLAMIGLALVLAVLVYGALFAPRHQGAYEPPHLENGQLVPGRFRAP